MFLELLRELYVDEPEKTVTNVADKEEEDDEDGEDEDGEDEGDDE